MFTTFVKPESVLTLTQNVALNVTTFKVTV